MLAGSLATVAAVAFPFVANTQQETNSMSTFTLPPLPYAYDALQPAIDKETMTFHHDKHHQAYVTALNGAVEADPALQGKSLEELVAVAGTLAPVVRNNGGGHWNHSFFWEIMGPDGGEPSAELTSAINEAFGSLDEMKAKFKEAGTKQFGSGWVWLIVGADGKLAITSTPNQDNPLMDVAGTKGTPILGNDVWEHAYYLTYQNRRADYLEGWWPVVNWTKVSEHFANANA
ncbi:superoxide dismutase [Croceibacterium mercuriale]|uniref:Superoxide dismutase n=2 Tax=Croceibacterium mercuriale TaxID=1572751 RepID=A0A0B2C0M8_9SPHN|nr:superoxide dismutase [Croceibacterium mercuriale]